MAVALTPKVVARRSAAAPLPAQLLSTLPAHARAKVKRVAGADEISSRLLEMGLTPGTEVSVIGMAPWGGPLILALRDYRLSVRRSEAARVEIELPAEPAFGSSWRCASASSAAMSTVAERSTITIAVVGNPNTGKSSLFTALTGVHQAVGNYPGVTVEKKIGRLRLGDRQFELVDLPGTCSLAPRSPDEMVAVDVLLGRHGAAPQVVLVIVDASSLERNLYLLSQVLDLRVPTVVALNKIDLAQARGITIDADLLSARLGVTVVEVQAHRKIGLAALRSALAEAVDTPTATQRESPLPAEFDHEVERLQTVLAQERVNAAGAPWPRYLVGRLLLDTTGYLEDLVARSGAAADAIRSARERLNAAGHPLPSAESTARYAWVADMLEGVVRRAPMPTITASDRIDRVLTHWIWGTLVFLLAMVLVFSSVFWLADPLQGLIQDGKGAIAEFVGEHMAEGPLRSLLVKGVIEGVGTVLTFLPQILILFLFLAALEDCGYMARAACLMDPLMVRIGLSGKSFIPLLSSFACAIPGVMATRVIENRRDRLVTILIAPLMSCSARLPVYTILIGLLIPDDNWASGLKRGVAMLGLYLVGIVVAAAMALVLKMSLLRGPTPPYILELPNYKVPSWRIVLDRMLVSGWSFVRRAGTLILAVSIVIWAALYYPHDGQVANEAVARWNEQKRALTERLSAVGADTPQAGDIAASLERLNSALPDDVMAGAYQRDSYLGRLGRAIEPAVRPLGWDWRVACAVLAAFPAREAMLSALAQIYDLGEGWDGETDADQARLTEQIRSATWESDGRGVFSGPVTVSILVFFALCAQCASTLVVIRRETNSWRWPALAFAYMTGLAYLGALVVYQVGSRFFA